MITKDWKRLATELNEGLKLQASPLAITFTQKAPEGVKPFDAPMPDPLPDGRTGRVPAGCVFWFEGVRATFSTVPEDHYNCSVGSVTHGLKRLEQVMGNDDVKCLVESDWVAPQDAMKLPFLQKRPNYITYGPLADVTIDPDVVLLRLNGIQAMTVHDAFGNETVIVDKPQCHIIPISYESQKIAVSTGCMLSRVRTGMSPNEITCTLPASRLEEAVEKLKTRRRANTAVAAYAAEDVRRFG